MIRSYTARYTKIAAGYMGQLLEWPEVVTEGRDLEDCREMLRDALATASLPSLGGNGRGSGGALPAHTMSCSRARRSSMSSRPATTPAGERRSR